MKQKLISIALVWVFIVFPISGYILYYTALRRIEAKIDDAVIKIGLDYNTTKKIDKAINPPIKSVKELPVLN